VLGFGDVTSGDLTYALIVSLLAAVLGWIAFARMDRTFADVI
jgi:ABC-type polysaccharide/polyol phosphate export permease